MNKPFLLLIMLILVSVGSLFAQNKVEKYCQVIVTPARGFTSKRIARISLGEKKNLFSLKDTSQLSALDYVNQLTTETDVLNYMTKLGWTLVNVHAADLYTAHEVFYFKKEFDKSELNE